MIENLHVELRSRGWTDIRPAYGFVLLAAREKTAVSDLATLMGMTKQAASKLVDGMVESGYLERSTGSPDGRRKEIGSPSVAIHAGRGRVIYRDLEQRWAVVVGEDRVERLRTDLQALLLDPATGQMLDQSGRSGESSSPDARGEVDESNPARDFDRPVPPSTPTFRQLWA